jgi:hypothetical protein
MAATYYYIVTTDDAKYKLTLRPMNQNSGYVADLVREGRAEVFSIGKFAHQYQFDRGEALQGVREMILAEALRAVASEGKIVSISTPIIAG